MTEEDFVDGEVIYADLRPDFLPNILWRTKDGTRVRVGDMDDSHIRNCALFLIGMGYQKCVATERVKLMWLKVFNLEWQRRVVRRKSNMRHYSGPVQVYEKLKTLSNFTDLSDRGKE